MRTGRPRKVCRIGSVWRVGVRTEDISDEGKVIRKYPLVTIGPSTGPDALTRSEAQEIADRKHTARLLTFRRAWAETRREFLASLPSQWTQRNARVWVNHLLGSSIADASLVLISTHHLQDFLDKKLQGGELAPLTVRQLGQFLTSHLFPFFRYKGFIQGHLPTDDLQLPSHRSERTRKRMSLRDGCSSVADRLPGTYRTLARMCTCMGLEFSESNGLRREYVNSSDFPVSVEGESIPAWAIAVFWRYTATGLQRVKGHARRIVFIPSVLRAEVDSLLGGLGPSDFLFATKSGRPPDHRNASEVLKEALLVLEMPTTYSWGSFSMSFIEHVENEASLSRAEKDYLQARPPGALELQDRRFDPDHIRAGVDRIGARMLGVEAPRSPTSHEDASELRAECRRILALAKTYGISERAIARKSEVDKRIIHRVKTRVAVKNVRQLRDLITAAETLIRQKKSVPT